MYDGLGLDLDETLVTTSEDYRFKIVNSVLEELGAGRASKEDINYFWLKTNRDETINNKFKIKDQLRFWKSYVKRDTVEERREHVSVYKDVHFIKELKEKNKNIKVVVITGALPLIADMEIDLINKELGGNYFDNVYILNPRNEKFNGIKQKPHPCGVLECIKQLGLKNFVFVGNSEEDIISAQEAAKLAERDRKILDVWVKRGNYMLDSGIKPSESITSLYELESLL